MLPEISGNFLLLRLKNTFLTLCQPICLIKSNILEPTELDYCGNCCYFILRMFSSLTKLSIFFESLEAQ